VLPYVPLLLFLVLFVVVEKRSNEFIDYSSDVIESNFLAANYLTVSFSIEDEAVVAELLRSNKGTLELVDARAEFLPKFKCRRGISTWHVLDDKPAYKDRGSNNNNNNKKNNNNNNSNSTKDVSVSAVEEAVNMSSDASERSTEKPAPLSTSDPYLLACMELGIRYFPNKESVSESDVFEKKRIRASLFPPTEEEKEWMHLGKV